jgi:hypothetical protein
VHAVIFSMQHCLCRQGDGSRGLVTNKCYGIPAVLFRQQHQWHAADGWQGRRCRSLPSCGAVNCIADVEHEQPPC